METRVTNKKLYLSKFIETYTKEMEGTVFAGTGQEMWIELYAENSWHDNKKNIKDKASAIINGYFNALEQAKRDKEALKKGGY